MSSFRGQNKGQVQSRGPKGATRRTVILRVRAHTACPLPPARSLVREFAAARKKSEREPGPVTWQRLEVYINTLKEYVSLIREHQHESLLAEVLGIKFRTTGPVSALATTQGPNKTLQDPGTAPCAGFTHSRVKGFRGQPY